MRKLLFILLLPLFAHAQVYTPAGGGTWMHTADNYHWGTAFSSNGFRKWYQSYQVDSATIHNGYAPQSASFNITKSGALDSAFTINSGFTGYYTVIRSNHNNSDIFDITQNGNATILKYGNPRFSTAGQFEFLQLGSTTTLINNLFGSVNLAGSIGSTSGSGIAMNLNSTVYAGANGDLVAGLVVQDTLSSGTPITALNNGSLVAGSGYTPGTYSVNFTNASNHYGATGSVVVGGGGTVTSATLVYGGYNYHTGDVLTAVFGGGSGFSINVSTVGAYTSTKHIGAVIYGGMQLVPTTYAALPGVLQEGSFYAITDATVNTWGTAITTGGGSDHVVCYFDGSNLTVVAK